MNYTSQEWHDKSEQYSQYSIYYKNILVLGCDFESKLWYVVGYNIENYRTYRYVYDKMLHYFHFYIGGFLKSSAVCWEVYTKLSSHFKVIFCGYYRLSICRYNSRIQLAYREIGGRIINRFLSFLLKICRKSSNRVMKSN